MYLYCRDCDWSQDDFWEEKGWNPITHLRDFEKNIFKEKIYLDSECMKDSGVILDQDEKGYFMYATDYVARQLRQTAKVIENMKIKTHEEWLKIKDEFKCPKCGKQNFGID